MPKESDATGIIAKALHYIKLFVPTFWLRLPLSSCQLCFPKPAIAKTQSCKPKANTVLSLLLSELVLGNSSLYQGELVM